MGDPYFHLALTMQVDIELTPQQLTADILTAKADFELNDPQLAELLDLHRNDIPSMGRTLWLRPSGHSGTQGQQVVTAHKAVRALIGRTACADWFREVCRLQDSVDSYTAVQVGYKGLDFMKNIDTQTH